MLQSPSYALVKNEDEEESGAVSLPPARDTKIGTYLAPISVIFVAISAFVNICLGVLLISNMGFGAQQDVYHGSMKTNSTYIGLDRLYSNATAFKIYPPIRNQARRFFQISSAYPERQLAEESPRIAGPTGFIPSARGFYQLLVSSEISTIVEFRVIDYGMENCNLSLNIPSNNATDQVTIASEGNLEIWQIGDINTRIDRSNISWNFRPKRTRFIASTSVQYGTSKQFESFRCVSGTHLTFELACTGCHLNVTRFSDKVHDALYIVQSQTLSH
uniref:Ubiquitin 3 binding protein But2 C-terminal domain-containing protein n=1 Tax=Psilocybe cubensis TaxID=181762 RepID=A0A8H7Y8W4_PSICU